MSVFRTNTIILRQAKSRQDDYIENDLQGNGNSNAKGRRCGRTLDVLDSRFARCSNRVMVC